ncbi:MAG: hypothetical protein ACYTBZ_29110 [Planctomycetota bacterium]|jgi:dihydrodipicolinate synthase/N-acetylneuraminate lyase
MKYDSKFAEFTKMCETAKSSGVDKLVIHHPEVLGDTYDELIESLNRLSEAGLDLAIVPMKRR